MKIWASLFKNRDDEWFTISTSLTDVKCVSINWRLALGGHWFGIVADVIYSSILEIYIMKYYVFAIDRYNFDKEDGSGKKKTFFGIPDELNGRFVTLGWAKFFTSIGFMEGTTTWKE